MRPPSSRDAASLAVLSLLAAACTTPAPPDAYGSFEATEVVVAAQASGQLRTFIAEEGLQLQQGAVVAVVDTTPLTLERAQLVAQRSATGARGGEVQQQLRVLEVQREIAQRTFERTRRLHDAQAATVQQLDQAERDVRVLGAQIEALRAQARSVGLDVASSDARVAQVGDRIARSTVVNPQRGTVLVTYARAGEVVQPGQPLYKIADLDTLVLRAYVTGAQLASLRLGATVQVHTDSSSGALTTIPGIVGWISPTAEFTPTPVQTRDERADLVYAVKIRVPNPGGRLRIGMPGDVTLNAFPAGGAASR